MLNDVMICPTQIADVESAVGAARDGRARDAGIERKREGAHDDRWRVVIAQQSTSRFVQVLRVAFNTLNDHRL